MFEQINSQFVSFTKQFADSAIKANSLALQNIEHALTSYHPGALVNRAPDQIDW